MPPPSRHWRARRSARPMRWRLPFEAARFDAVVCQFGAMFFPDRVAGYREARRVLKPGGRLLFSMWDPSTTIP